MRARTDHARVARVAARTAAPRASGSPPAVAPSMYLNSLHTGLAWTRCLAVHSTEATALRTESHVPVAAQSVSTTGTAYESKVTIVCVLKDVATPSTAGSRR